MFTDALNETEKPPKKTVKKTQKKKEKITSESSTPYDFPTGDYGDMENLAEKEQKEKIRKLQIGNEKELRNLVERELVVSILGEVGQSIQNNIVDQAKRKSPLWAAKLGIPEKERDIEQLLSELGEEEVSGLISDIERLSDEGVFE